MPTIAIKPMTDPMTMRTMVTVGIASGDAGGGDGDGGGGDGDVDTVAPIKDGGGGSGTFVTSSLVIMGS